MKFFIVAFLVSILSFFAIGCEDEPTGVPQDQQQQEEAPSPFDDDTENEPQNQGPLEP